MPKMIRNIVGLSTIGTFAMALCAGPAMAQSTANDDATDGVDAGLLTAMAAELGTDIPGAEQVLALQANAAAVVETVASSSGSGFAGSWLDEGTGTVYAAVATNEAEDAAATAGATPVRVTYSLDELEAAVASLDAAGTQEGVASWWIDVRSNSIVIDVIGDGESAAKQLVAEAGVDENLITYASGADAPQTFAKIRGGEAYYINNSSRCSVGFGVVGGFVTAGHCGDTGDSTNFGTFQGSSFPGNDYAWVRTPGHTPAGEVSDYNGSSVAVKGSKPAVVGSTVCRSGSTTGWHCGTLQAYNSSVTYPQGTVTGLIRTSVCAERGDSGGSLLAGNQAQGVTSGGSGDCRSGGRTYFQPVNEILDTYGLQLLTR